MVSAACGGVESGSADGGARDSAGIQIVENTAPLWSEANAWRLSPSPILDLGGAGADSAHEFYRVAGVVRLTDGTIVVANSGTSQLRYFAADGTTIRSVGREGAGPGEFRTLLSLHRLPGDSLLAYDPMNRRLTLLDAAGRHVRDVSLPTAMGFVLFQLAGRLPDGSYLVHAPSTPIGPEMLSRPLGAARDSILVLRLDTAGVPVDTLGTFPAGIVEVRNMEMFGRSMPVPIPIPFTPSTMVAAGPDAVYVGTSDSYEIRVLSPDGALRRLIRREVPARPVTQADRDAMTARMRDLPSQGGAQLAPMMEQFQKAMAEIDYPETMPAYGSLRLDAEGNLWVAEHSGGAPAPVHWSVFGPDGRFLGTVTMPERFQVREIGADYVLGELTDETEIEHVLLYQLIKPE
jgi:hypothetical protein